jgi:hypothetical protein
MFDNFTFVTAPLATGGGVANEPDVLDLIGRASPQ